VVEGVVEGGVVGHTDPVGHVGSEVVVLEVVVVEGVVEAVVEAVVVWLSLGFSITTSKWYDNTDPFSVLH
jgi:hypothetical protein